MDHNESVRKFEHLMLKQADHAREAAIELEVLVSQMPSEKSRQLTESPRKLARSRGGPAVSLRSDNGRRSVRFCLGKIWGTIGEQLFPIKVISARIRAHRPM